LEFELELELELEFELEFEFEFELELEFEFEFGLEFEFEFELELELEFGFEWGKGRAGGGKPGLAGQGGASAFVAAANQAGQDAADFVASVAEARGGSVIHLALGDQQPQAHQGLHQRATRDGIESCLVPGVVVAGSFGDVCGDAGGRAADLVAHAEVASGDSGNSSDIHCPGKRLLTCNKPTRNLLLFHALNYRKPAKSPRKTTLNLSTPPP
jgi:hypothetical protein